MKPNLTTWLVVSLFLLVIAAAANAKTIYVDADAAGGSGTGADWANAYNYLQDALTVADADDDRGVGKELGEVFGQVQNLKYGSANGEIFFAVFDILRGDQWLDFEEAREIASPLTWVPLVYRGPFDKDKILEFAERDSLWPSAKHYREGVVVKPIHERTDRKIGRVQLKVVGNRYLSKS